MPNPEGKNGWGTKAYPPDDVLKDFLLKYAARSLTIAEKLSRLQIDLNLSIGKSKLNTLERKFEIPTVRRPKLSAEVIELAIVEEVQKDTLQRCGPMYIKSKLKDNLIMVPRDKVRTVMRRIAPDGFEERFPKGRKKIQRKTLRSAGPFREISADGYEKLNAQALRMGEVSLPIYGYRDKWSGSIVKLCLVPNSRSAAVLGHVFLDFVSQIGGIPVQMTTDKGSEVGWQFALQDALRDIFAPDIDRDAYPPFITIPSTRNIVIESFWKWFLEKTGRNLKDLILVGKDDNIFHLGSNLHRDLFYWIFVPLIQRELDEYSVYWNQRSVRPQPNKEMPSGHVPDDALEHPNLFGGIDCLIRVSDEAQQELCDYLTEEVGARDENIFWYSNEFETIASTAYQLLGEPPLTLQKAWETFSMMAELIQEEINTQAVAL